MRRLAWAVGLAMLGVAACSKGGVPPEQVQAWVGRPAADLIREWGAPTKEVQDGGQRVLIYEEMERTGSAEFSRTVSPRYQDEPQAATPTPTPTINYNSYARSYLFWVDAAGKISQTKIHQP
jgi:hypothetical protein